MHSSHVHKACMIYYLSGQARLEKACTIGVDEVSNHPSDPIYKQKDVMNKDN